MISSLLISLALLSSIGVTSGADMAGQARAQARLPGKSIAVIAGQNKRVTQNVADILTEALNRQSSMEVFTSERIKARFEHYPINIQGPFLEQPLQVTLDPARTDVKATREIKDQLGVEYLYVVWLSESRMNGTGATTYRFQTQLFAGPSCALVKNGEIESYTGGRMSCIWFLPASEETRLRQLVHDCDKNVQQLLVVIERMLAGQRPR